jgi:hypothetical protein
MVRGFTVLHQNYFEILRIKSIISGISKADPTINHKYHGLDLLLMIKLELRKLIREEVRRKVKEKEEVKETVLLGELIQRYCFVRLYIKSFTYLFISYTW